MGRCPYPECDILPTGTMGGAAIRSVMPLCLLALATAATDEPNCRDHHVEAIAQLFSILWHPRVRKPNAGQATGAIPWSCCLKRAYPVFAQAATLSYAIVLPGRKSSYHKPKASTMNPCNEAARSERFALKLWSNNALTAQDAAGPFLPDVTQYCIRAGNQASGPDFGRIL